MLTLRFVPYHEIESLDSDQRIQKLLKLAKEDKIILMQGRLEPTEETQLIQKTMEQISKKFKGIEICTIYPQEKSEQFIGKLRKELAKILIGDREGFTVIGPATIIKEIKRDPNKIQLFAENPKNKKRRSRRK